MKNTIATVGILSLLLISAQFVRAEGDCGGEDELRHYSGHVARWLGIDPLADKYPDVSPYVYCEYNPLMYVDPDGRYCNKYNERMAQQIIRKLLRIMKKYKKMNDQEAIDLIQKKIDGLRNMNDDKLYEYRFVLTPINSNETKGDGLNENNQVVVKMRYADDELKSHESMHGAQISCGDYDVPNGKNIENSDNGYGVENEVEAYKMQIIENGSLTVFIKSDNLDVPLPKTFDNYKEIDEDVVKHMYERNKEGEYVPAYKFE